MKKVFFGGLFLLLLVSCLNGEKQEIYTDVENISHVCPPVEGELITLKSGVIVTKRGDDYLYLGDILLSEKDLRSLDETGDIFSEKDYKYDPREIKSKGTPLPPEAGMAYVPQQRELLSLGYAPYVPRFWTMVRYKFDKNINSYQKKEILNAIKHIEEKTNARFYDSTGEPDKDPKFGFTYPNVIFTASYKNESYVGKVGGNQEVHLVNFNLGTIVHEICHVLGMFHEQSRYDRDQHITINHENIIPGKEDQFQKIEKHFHMSDAFDFNSVMLYGSYHFARNPSKPTMTKRNGETFSGQRNGLSEEDRKWINKFYLPYISRKDVCYELDKVVYDLNNQPLSEYRRQELERQLNEGRCNYPLPRR